MTGCHPLTSFGVLICSSFYPAFRRVAAPRWAMILSPLRAQVSARLRLAKFQFCVSLKQYSLIAGAIKNAPSRITSDEARLAKHQRNAAPSHSRNKAQFKAQFKAFAYTSDVYNKHTTTQFKAQFKAQNRLQMGCFSKGAGHILAGGPNWKGDLPGLRTNEAPLLKGTCEIPLAFASQASLLRHSYFKMPSTSPRHLHFVPLLSWRQLHNIITNSGSHPKAVKQRGGSGTFWPGVPHFGCKFAEILQ